MTNEHTAFNQDKAIEAIVYLARRIADPTFHSIAKLMYFADKTHLEKYGRFICGDTYYAMQLGPVPTNIYQLLKEKSHDFEDAFVVKDGRKVVAIREANQDELSDSDIQCLDIVIEMYGNVPMWKRTEDSHDDAWRYAWENRGSKKSVLMTVESIAGMFEDYEDLLSYLSNPHPE